VDNYLLNMVIVEFAFHGYRYNKISADDFSCVLIFSIHTRYPMGI
jgi:hypothetical protein